MVRERAVSKIMSGSWLVDLVVSFLATGVNGITLIFGAVHYEFELLKYREDRNLICLIH